MNACPSCNAQIESDARYCDICGTALRARTSLPPQRRAMRLGADPECELVVEAPAVSSTHAVVWLEGQQLWIGDVGSMNGTYIDGAQLDGPTPLSHDSSVALGGVTVDMNFVRQRLPRGRPALLVGRDSETDLNIDASMVSGRHLLVLPRPSGATILDLGSSNGTFVGQRDERIHGAVDVDRDDTLYLGSYRLPAAMLLAQLGVTTGGKDTRTATQSLSLETRPLILGRDPDCDVVLPYPQVSLRHARLTPRPNGACLVEDLGSSNGTFVNGERIKKGVLDPGGTLHLASYRVTIEVKGEEQKVRAETLRGAIRLDGFEITRVVRNRNTGKPLVLLDDISVSIYPSEFVGLMGPSGAGKTTVLLALNGYEPPTEGHVFINGEDLYANYDRFRGLIGYLPQDDIIHGELTVGESLYFTAKLRLPSDTSHAEIEERIDAVLVDLNLTDQRDQVVGTIEQKVLSGGQRKRVNLAQELVIDPQILFLDEPTSGLSAKDTVDVMDVLRGLADQGRTIVLTIHQPSHDVYAKMDHLMLLATGGKLAYFGPTVPGSYDYFSVSGENPDQVMARLDGKSADEWKQHYRSSAAYSQYVEQRLDKASDPSAQPRGQIKARSNTPSLRQWWTLTHRYWVTKKRDRTGLAFMAAQAPLVGVALALFFHGAREAPHTRGLPLFIACLAAVLFGSFNAYREVVRERAIYHRERMVNLKLLPYVMSKFVVLGAFGIAQVVLLYLILVIAAGLDGFPIAYLAIFSATILAATALGLAISSLMRSSEAALATVVVVLIFQIILSGYLVPLKQDWYVEVFATPMVSRWTVEGLLDVERQSLEEDVSDTAVDAEGTPPPGAAIRSFMEERDLTAERAWFDVMVLLFFTVFFLMTAVVFLRLHDRRA